jgi:probable HAF family extracellular repeat protein
VKFKIWNSVVMLTLFSLAKPAGVRAQDNPSQEHKSKHHQYTLIDLGTFGGPWSQGPGVDNGGPLINGRGAVVGNAETTVPLPPNSNGFNCAGPNVSHALRWQDGQSTDLGALSPSDNNCSIAQAINDSGAMAGNSENGVIDPVLGLIEMRAVLWMNGEIVDLGTFGGTWSGAFSINNHGEIAGFALNTIPDPFSLFYLGIFGSPKGTQTRAFVRKNGEMKDLGTLGGPDAFAGLVNERGQVAGTSYTNSTPNPTTGVPTLDPFLWEDDRMIDLGSFGGTMGGASALNRRGQVAGQSNLAGDLTVHPFFWDRGILTDIGTFGGSNGAADAMNDSGEVAGEADFPGDQIHHAFLWKDSRMTDLGTAGGAPCSNAFSINSQGQVVGDSTDCHGSALNAFIWENGSIANLNDLVSPKSSVLLIDPNAIADNGEILVNGLPPGCGDEAACAHAYVLIPNGDCDDNCEARIAASQNRAVPEQYPSTMSEGSESPINPVKRLRSWLMQRHRIFGQRVASRD